MMASATANSGSRGTMSATYSPIQNVVASYADRMPAKIVEDLAPRRQIRHEIADGFEGIEDQDLRPILLHELGDRSASFCGSRVTVSAMLSYTISLPMALTSVNSNSCKSVSTFGNGSDSVVR